MVKKLTRGIKACTNCRQQKIRCDASETSPAPCRRCAKMGKECIIDPEFKPRKGSQVDMLREEMAALKRQMAGLGPTEEVKKVKLESPTVHEAQTVPQPAVIPDFMTEQHPDTVQDQHIKLPQPTAGPYTIDNVRISDEQAARLHSTFVELYLPMMPIVETNSSGELYSQSETLFWTVMFIAALSDPTPDLYLRLVDPLKRLVVKTCYLETPRSTHVVQALVLLATWNMPNEKVSDDPSYRYLTLARSIAMQLGLHRGKFIYEFTRKQKLMPNAVKWRTRTWTWIYVSEQVLSAVLGVPSNMRVDYLIEEAMCSEQTENAQVRLWAWYSNMALLMGSSTRTPDGLLNSRVRMPSIEIFAQDLDRMGDQLPQNDPSVRITLEYCRLLLYIYAFLPGTTETDQSTYICPAFEAATRLITLSRQFVGRRRISEFPTQIRQATTFAAFLLFKLHALPQFPSKWSESARQSIVTVHHLYRNISHGWSTVPNDVTRAAKILESLNVVLISHPELLTGSSVMVTHMRSHLSYSLFYEIIWTIHEARRRTVNSTKENSIDMSSIPQQLRGPEIPPEKVRRLPPLPLFNQISSEEYASSTYTSPNGTTMTTLVPASTLQHAPHPVVAAGATGAPDVQTDIDELLQGIDWMSHEGDDFLGWVPNGEFLI